MSEQKRSTPQRSDAPTQRRRSNASPRRRSSRRGGMPQWLSGWIEHMALFFSTLGARIRRIGPRARTVMRESRARNFPESNRFLVQVFLVIGGMFPMWRSLLHERVMAHRRQRSHAAGEHEDRWRRQARRVNPFYFIGGAAVVAAIALFFSFYTLGTTVEYNGSVVDTVASAAQARKAASKLESITTETLGKSYEIAKDAIHYSTAFVRRSDVTDSTTFEQDLADELGQVTYGYSLYVDDELIGSTQYAGALDELLKQIKQVYASADTLSVDFVENVRIAEGYVPTDSVMNLGEIIKGTPVPFNAHATSYTADNCGTPTPATTRVVQMDPGPIPTFMPSAPASTNIFAASPVATLPTTISTSGNIFLASLNFSITYLEWP